MKKEKKVRTYQRRTKSGKTITVRAHTASYEAADKAKEAAKKKGAGDEFSSKVKKGDEWKLPMNEFLDKLKEERAKKREDEEPKNVEDEKPKKKSEKKSEKKTPAKKATKKRTVGTGTNGPEPKKKESSDDKVMNRAKSMYSHNNPSGSKDSIVVYLQKKGYSLKEAKSKANSIEKSAKKERKSRIEQGYLPSTNASSSKKTPKSSDTTFTAAEFKEWYRGTGSAADKKVAKALRKQLGRSGYRKFEDEAIDNYTSRGHLSMFKRVSGGSSTGSTKESNESKVSKVSSKVPKAKPEKKSVKGSLGITKSEFKEWYSDTDGSSPSFKKVNKALKKFYGKDWEQVENRAIFGGSTQYQDMVREIGSRFATYPKTSKKETSSKKRSVGTGTNGPEPKKAKTASAPSMKKELAHLLTGVNGSTLRTWNKPAKFLSRKDGTLEASADDHKMSLSLSKAGWKNIDKVSIMGGTSNFVSPDGKYHAIVGSRKTKIKPIKKGEKVSGHSWDSIFGGNDHSASRYD